MTSAHVVSLPDQGVWRLGRGVDPLAGKPPEPVNMSDPGVGNRFDSFHGNYKVVYAASTAEACFAECLARFRPSPRLADLVRDEWSERNWMSVGSIPADWRNSRVLVQLEVPNALPFLDISHSDTLQALREDQRIMGWLTSLGLNELDLSEVVSRDRRITRLVSQWAAEATDEDDHPLYGGIRYLSRMGGQYVCWAFFEETNFVTASVRPVLATDIDLCTVAKRYGLVVH